MADSVRTLRRRLDRESDNSQVVSETIHPGETSTSTIIFVAGLAGVALLYVALRHRRERTVSDDPLFQLL